MAEWFRTHTNILDNLKIAKLTDKQFRFYFKSKAVMKRCGRIPDWADYAFAMRMTETDVRKHAKELIDLDFLDELEDGSLAIHDWDEWQFTSEEKPRTKAAEKQRRYRNKKRSDGNENGNGNGNALPELKGNVTSNGSGDVTVTPSRAHARSEQNRTEQNRSVTSYALPRNAVTDNCEEIFHRVVKRHAANYRHAMKMQMIVDAWCEALALRPDEPMAQACIIDKAHECACSTDSWSKGFREGLDKWISRGGYRDEYPEPEDDGIESAKDYLAREAARYAAQGD